MVGEATKIRSER